MLKFINSRSSSRCAAKLQRGTACSPCLALHFVTASFWSKGRTSTHEWLNFKPFSRVTEATLDCARNNALLSDIAGKIQLPGRKSTRRLSSRRARCRGRAARPRVGAQRVTALAVVAGRVPPGAEAAYHRLAPVPSVTAQTRHRAHG